MTNPTPRTTRVPNTTAGTGAVHQHGGSLPVYVCNACKREVVWVKSSRTGRPYLVTVTRGQADQRFYMGHNVHPRDCGERFQAEVDALEARENWTRISRDVADVQLLFSAALRSGEIDTDTFLAALDTLALLFPPTA